ncbi:head-tail connector protein, partial [Nocardia grenadensis]
ATLDEAKSYILKEVADVDDSARDLRIQSALNAATSAVDNYCGRQFNRSEEATAREYIPTSSRYLAVDDFWTKDGLIVQSGHPSWGWGTPWSIGEYVLEPLNGVANGVPGWPFRRFVMRSYGPQMFCDETVRVTAKWGWESVPAPVKQATLIMTAELFKIEDAPLGVEGFKDFGVHKVQQVPQVKKMLCDYQINKVLVA